MFTRSQNNNNNNSSKKKNSSVSSVVAVGGQTTSMSVSPPAAAAVKSRSTAENKRSRNRTNASASLSASPGEPGPDPYVAVRTPAAATPAAAAHSPFDRAVRSGPAVRAATGAGAIRGRKCADVAGLQTGAPSPVQLMSVRSLESDDSVGASYSSDSSCSGYQGRLQRQQQSRHRYSDAVFAVGGSPVMTTSSEAAGVMNFGVGVDTNGTDAAVKLALNNNEGVSYGESVALDDFAASKGIKSDENTRKVISDKSSENCMHGQQNLNGVYDVEELHGQDLHYSVQTAVTVESDEPTLPDRCTQQLPAEFHRDFKRLLTSAMPTHAVGDDTTAGDTDEQDKFTAQYGPISLQTLPPAPLEFRRMNSDFDDPMEKEPSYGFPPSVTEFIADETILPPPVLFENGCSFPVDETDQDVMISVDILPPPEEFGSHWHLVASNQTNTDQTETGGEVVLPPPDLFGTSDPDSATDHCDNQVGEVSPADQRCDISDATNPDESQTPNGKLEEVRSTENVKEIVSALEARLNGHSPAKSPGSGSELITIKVVAEVNPKTFSEEEGIHPVPMYVVPSRQRLASDAMEKLDALCKSHEIPVERKTYTRIPVFHETTASGNKKLLHRKAVADSWPGGIFSQDRLYDVAGADESVKRHSTGATIGNIGARPKVPMPKPKIFLEELERKRKEEHIRTSTHDMEKASDAQSPQRLLFTRYTPDGREFCFHSGCDRMELTEGRQKSLDRGDLRQKNEAAATPRRPLVVSEGDISKSSMLIDWTPEDSQQFCNQQLTAKSKLAAVRKNLLEKANERRKESRIASKSSSPPAVDSCSSEPTGGAATVEKSDTSSKVDLPNDESTSPVIDQLPTKLSNTTRSSCSSLSEQSSLEIWQKSSPTASSDSGTADVAPKKTARRLETSKSLDASSFSDISGIQRQLSVERSVETMQVPRPASIVLSTGKTATSTPELGSPVRVVVDGKEISAGNVQPTTAVAPQSTSTGSASPMSTSTVSISVDSSLPLLAPLCSPEASFDATSSEIPSGRNSPSTISVSTFPGNSSSAGDLLTSPMPTDSGRHFIVVAIDFGTTYSGYAFSFVRDPDSVHMMRRWEGGDPGVVNQKTPTTLLLDPSGRFHSFGYAARDAYHDLDAQEAKKWLYFEKFKMALHYNAELNKETAIKASNGRSYLALTVFSHALHFFYEHALQELSDQSATTIVNDDIRWIITVPAIWKAPAKQFMRLAAYEAGIASADNPSQLLIALEPEAASVYVRKLRLYQLVPEPPYVAPPRREPTPDLSSSLDHVSDDEFNKSEDAIKYKTLPAVHFRNNFCPTSTTITVGHEVDIEGTRYMVVDCGGGTVDITVYEMESRYGCLKELHKATGGPFGSVGVDVAFERLLVEIFGSDFIEAFKVKRPAGWVDLMAAFESRKRTASPFKNTPLNVSLPFSFIDYHKKCRSGHVEGVIRKYGSREVSWSSQGMLRLTTEAMRRLFQPTLDSIKVAIGDVLNHPNCRDIRYMFLVGGFSESPILQLEMRKEFSHLLKIIIPQDVALTILKGAVIFGIDPTVVGVRRSRLTYGVGVLHRFVPGKHPQSKKITRDGSAWCVDVFDRFVTVDQEVAVGDIVVRSYAPARPGQRSTVIHIYCSDRTDVAYVTDPGVRRCGTLCLDLTDALYHDTGSAASSHANTPRLRNRRREIRARMTFGDTEIRVDALDVATGRCVRAGIDFLNK